MNKSMKAKTYRNGYFLCKSHVRKLLKESLKVISNEKDYQLIQMTLIKMESHLIPPKS